MGHWIIRLKFNELQSGNSHTEAGFKKLKNRVLKYLRTDPKAVKCLPKRFADAFEKTKTVKQWDKVLDRLYDYADANDIWLGF